MAQIVKYRSDIDGKEFDTEHEQLSYDAGKRNEAEINTFLDLHYPVTGPKAGPARAIVGKGLAKWFGYVAQTAAPVSTPEA